VLRDEVQGVCGDAGEEQGEELAEAGPGAAMGQWLQQDGPPQHAGDKVDDAKEESGCDQAKVRMGEGVLDLAELDVAEEDRAEDQDT
jgi:hypothetical protein